MPEMTITIGGREFRVACQEGEEAYLRAAADLLDVEAQALAGQAGRLTDARMTLMAGLMLADKTAALEEELRTLRARLDDSARLIEELRRMPAREPEQRTVAVLPEGLEDSLAELAARAEALAEQMTEQMSGRRYA